MKQTMVQHWMLSSSSVSVQTRKCGSKPDRWPHRSATESIAYTKLAGMIAIQRSFYQKRALDKRTMLAVGEEWEED